MQAKLIGIFLSGGKSSRIWPIQEKNLLPFLGKPLIWHSISRAVSAGLKDIIVVCSDKNKQRIEQSLVGIPAEITCIVQEDSRGMAGAVLSAKEVINRNSVAIFNATDIVDASLFSHIVELHESGKYDRATTGYQTDTYRNVGYLKITQDKKLVGVIEKPGEGNEPSNLIKLVADYFRDSASWIGCLEKASSSSDDIYEVALDSMIQDGRVVHVIPYEGPWATIKYPWDIFSVIDVLASESPGRVAEDVEMGEGVVIKGKVIIDEGVRILQHAVINGEQSPVYIGKGSVVGNNALVRNGSHLGERSVVGYATEVSRSYWQEECWTHSNYIGDSIIGKNSSFGAGAVTANFRFDGKELTIPIKGEHVQTKREKLGAIVGSNVRIGINASILPGRKIGSNTFIGAHVCVSEDIEDGQYVYVDQSIIRKKSNTMTPNPSERKALLKGLQKINS